MACLKTIHQNLLLLNLGQLVSVRVDEFLLCYSIKIISVKQIGISVEPVTEYQQDIQYFQEKYIILTRSK